MKKWIGLIFLMLVMVGLPMISWGFGGDSYIQGIIRVGITQDGIDYVGFDNQGIQVVKPGVLGPPAPDPPHPTDNTAPEEAEALHIIAISSHSMTLAWQETSTAPAYRLVYATDNYPADENDGVIGYQGNYSSAQVDGLDSGTTYYWGLWSITAGIFSDNAAYCVGTTSAGFGEPEWTDESGTTDDSILAGSPLGGFIDFMSDYSQLPDGTVGLLGYSSIFVFALMGVATYNRSTFMVIVLALIGLALGNSLGVYAFVFLFIAAIGGIAVGVLRGGQPTGG